MFLFYQKHNEFVYSITEVITSMALYVWYNIIVCILLFILMITVLKYCK